jgi:Cu2+-exporting ATPase
MKAVQTSAVLDLAAAPACVPGVATACAHCGQALAQETYGAFCCRGCRAVHDALQGAGLSRFYALRGALGEPVGELGQASLDQGLLDALEQRLALADQGPQRLSLSVQGVRCAACVWVLEQVFSRLPGALRLELSAATGRAELWVDRSFPIRRYAQDVHALGYRLGARGAARSPDSDRLLLRLGACSALAMNAMAFGAAIHVGVPPGPLHQLLTDLGFGAAALCVLIGGPLFFGSAWRALRAGALHLDVPIAVGIALTTGAATWSYLGGHHGAAYFDSLAAFVALMVAGRYLQERAVSRSRAELLEDPGVANLTCRVERDGRLEQTACKTLQTGDVLLVPSGELVPVRAELLSAAANLSLAWIDGEAEPRAVTRGQSVPSGAFNVGSRALRLRALEPFDASELLELLKPSTAQHAVEHHLHRFCRLYVLAVLGVAALGFCGWFLATGDLVRAISVATAICVVTCPCAIGIAIPLAYELAHTRLRRRGVFVRDGSFLDRARAVRRVVFDKTGTLTTGRLRVSSPERVHALTEEQRSALYQLCARSVHPKSLALADLLSPEGLRYDAELEVDEQPGLGVQASIGGRCYRLGRGSFVAPDAGADDGLCFGADGRLLARLETAETFRPDAAAELAALERAGYSVFILSGDDEARARDAAERLGLPPNRALGGCSPKDKAAWLRTHDGAHALMVGDGVNDALAVAEAQCSATPAIDRPFLPARTDFYFTSPGLGAVGAALRASRDLAAIVRRNLVFAVGYNVLAVGAALAGLMAPWLAAIVMPLSSIVVVARTSAAIARRSRAWKL